MPSDDYEHWDPDDPLYDPEDDDAGHRPVIPSMIADLFDDPEELTDHDDE